MNYKKKLVLLVLCMIIGVTGYYYTQTKISINCEEVFNTIKDKDWRVEEYTFFPPSMTIVLVYSISNPTNIPLEIEMDIDFYAGDYQISNLYENKQLALGDETTFEIELVYNSTILQKIYANEEGYDSFTMDGWFKVKGNIFFISVESTKNFENEDVLSILPTFDVVS